MGLTMKYCEGRQFAYVTMATVALLVTSALHSATGQMVELRVIPSFLQHGELGLPGSVIRQNDNVTVLCSVQPFTSWDLMRVNLATKKSEEHELSTNGLLVQNFARSQRYETSMTAEGDKVTTTVKIIGVTGSDSGDFVCKHMNSQKSAQESFKVHADVQSVSLFQKLATKAISDDHNEQTEDDGTIKDTPIPLIPDTVLTLQEDVTSVIGCDVKVEGGDGQPEVYVYWGTRDITKSFCELQVDQKSVTSDIGLPRTDTDVKYTCSYPSPRRTDNGANVTCVARMPYFQPKTAAVSLQVVYAPKLLCKKVFHAKLGAKDFVMSCKVSMWPAPTGGWWKWRDENGEEIAMPLKSELDDMTSDVVEYPPPQQMVVSLTFADVTANVFNNYTLIIENRLGTANATMELAEDTGNVVEEAEPTEPPEVIIRDPHVVGGKASHLTCSTLLTLTAVTIMSLLH